jgi:hypothetical protein
MPIEPLRRTHLLGDTSSNSNSINSSRIHPLISMTSSPFSIHPPQPRPVSLPLYIIIIIFIFIRRQCSLDSAESFQQQQQRPHDIFGVNQPHYPSVSLPHSRPPYARDDFSSTTPASVHNSYGRAEYFPNGGPQHQNNTSETARQTAEGRQPHELQQQQQQSQSYGMMASALSNSSVVDSFNPGGEQAPETGVTRARSRSRSKVSASRSRVSKRPSLPAPPHEEDGESPDSSRAQSITRPSAIVIPGGQVHHGHHASHSFSSYHTAGTGHPTSPATWAFSGHSAAGEQLFGQSFGGPGSLGPGQSPTTHSGSPPPTGNVDTATK